MPSGSSHRSATRIVPGLAFFQAGMGKFRHFESVVDFFDSPGIPFPAFNAGLVASMETVGGVMLIAGLFTRFFASGLTVTVVVALVTDDTAAFLSSWGSASEVSPTDVTAFTFVLFLLWLVFLWLRVSSASVPPYATSFASSPSRLAG